MAYSSGPNIKFMPNPDRAESYVLKFIGLEDTLRIGYEAFSRKSPEILVVPTGSPIPDVWHALEGLGFKSPYYIQTDSGKFFHNSTKLKERPHDKIQVVSGKPIGKFEINVDETFQACANRLYGKHVAEFNIGDVNSGDPKRPKQMIKDDRGLNISFQRTPRMPDDNKLHQLPGTLGSYNLFNVEAYADRLPANIRNAGGVFLPMWQREAMWINFVVNRIKNMEAPKYAVRVFVGKINAVSGLRMDEDPAKAGLHTNQDYVVIPGQRWLDGICVAPGIVRQFVAMPLGSGYTIEGQKTSEEKYGGLQIEVIPQYQSGLRRWVTHNKAYLGSNPIDEMKTPANIGLSPGDIVRSHDLGEQERVPYTIDDMVKDVTIGCIFKYQDNPKPGMLLVEGRPSKLKLDDLNDDDIGSTHSYYAGAAMPVAGAAMLAPARSSIQDKPKGSLFDLGPTGDVAPLISSLSLSDGSTPPAPKGTAVELAVNEEKASELDADSANKYLQAMGLAAGGKLVQDIYKDNYPADSWNHAAARIINVHILDPASCEKVTHIVPLPPPDDAKSYAEKGGKFFVVEEQVDNRVDGGDFEGVKSVSQMDKHIGVNKEDEFDPTKPSMCTECKIRLTDCIVRPCNHQFCNMCINSKRKCRSCGAHVSHVAGFSAPMNLPGEEPMRMKVPVNVLEINDERVRFKATQTTRM